MIPVIISGGSGTRLWPLSRKTKPKQFLTLFGEASLFQNTLKRLAEHPEAEAPMVVCNVEQRFMVAEQLQEISLAAQDILLEPSAKNTAPAIALAALRALESGADPILLILPADHIINKVDVFHSAIDIALPYAEQGQLVTFGIQPNTPHTGYGYIEATDPQQPSAIRQFVEKPDLATAESYLAAGNFFWNSGMFLFKASTFVSELQTHAPAILSVCRQALGLATKDLDFIRIDPTMFDQCPSDSIDYAVMEKTQKAIVVPLDAQWSDVGSWSSLWDVYPQDDAKNVLIGDVLAESVEDSFVYSEARLVAVLGLQDIVVVETDDAVLVADKSRTEEIKKIVDKLTQQSRKEVQSHRRVYRPWGHYDSVDFGQRFQVKRITVNPGASLSLQKHYHRAEHWVVVSGTAEVTRDDEVLLLSENQSTYIPLGTVHRLKNPGRVPLEIIEVQSGSYLEEDDIVRFEDSYNRQ